MSNTTCAVKSFTFRAVILFNRMRCIIDCSSMYVINLHRTQLLSLFDRLCYSSDLNMCILSPIRNCKCLAIFGRWRRNTGVRTSMYCVLPAKLSWVFFQEFVNPLKPELNPICYLLALLGAHHFLHVSRIRVKLLTFRRLMLYIYGAPILDVSRSHTTTQHSR